MDFQISTLEKIPLHSIVTLNKQEFSSNGIDCCENEWKKLLCAKGDEKSQKQFSNTVGQRTYAKKLDRIRELIPSYREKSIEDEKLINFINRTKIIFEPVKRLPIEIDQAALQSQIFTERENQLKLNQVLREYCKDQETIEKKQFAREAELYAKVVQDEKYKSMKKKHQLNKEIKKELRNLELTKKRKMKGERDYEKEMMRYIFKNIEEDEKIIKRQQEQMKQNLKKMFINDQHQKAKFKKQQMLLELEETKLANVQNIFHQKKQDIMKIEEKKIQQTCRNLPLDKPKLLLSSKKEEDISSSNLRQKSYIETKREIYLDNLKQQRIKAYENQIKELESRKDRDKIERELEFKRRLKNLHVTKLLEGKKFQKSMVKWHEFNKTWDQQCREKEQVQKIEKESDRKRMEKLQKDVLDENENFLKGVKTLLNNCVQRKQNIFPVIKCLKSFKKNVYPEPTLRNQDLISKIPI